MAEFQPIEVEFTPNQNFRPIEVGGEIEAAPVAEPTKKPAAGKKES